MDSADEVESKSSDLNLSLPTDPKFVIGITNNSLCIESGKYALIEKLNLSVGSMLGLWLKHNCSYKSNSIILRHKTFGLKCNPDQNFPIAVFDIYKTYLITGKSGIWYHLSIIFQTPLQIYINGKSVVTRNGTSSIANVLGLNESLQLRSTENIACFDELFTANNTDIWPIYFDQLYGSITTLAKVKKTFHTVGVQVQLKQKYEAENDARTAILMIFNSTNYFDIIRVEQRMYYTMASVQIYVPQFNDSVLDMLENLLSPYFWWWSIGIENRTLEKIEYRIMNYPSKNCAANMDVLTQQECQNAIVYIQTCYGVQINQNLAVVNQNGIPFGCSIQMGFYTSSSYQNFSGYWNIKESSDNSLLINGEFLKVCRTDPGWLSTVDRENNNNLAKSKNATSSDAYPIMNVYLYRITDGLNLEFFSTKKITASWIQVNLNYMLTICKVVLYAWPGNAYTIAGFVVKIGNSSSMTNFTLCNQYNDSNNALDVLEIVCVKCSSGQYVRYEMTEVNAPAMLAELEVYGLRTDKKIKFQDFQNELNSEKLVATSNYEMNGHYMSWIERSIPGHATLSLRIKVLSITGEVFIDEFEVLNTDYIDMTSLTPYTKFVPCFKVSTPRENLNVYGKFNCNFSSFISAESEPLQAPDLFNCFVLSEKVCTINCMFYQINTTSWQGKPYSYEIYWGPIESYSNVQNNLCNWGLSMCNQTMVSNTMASNYSIKLESDKSYTNTCIVLLATTGNGLLKGVRSVKCLRSCRGEPAQAPDLYECTLDNKEFCKIKCKFVNINESNWRGVKYDYKVSYGRIDLINESKSDVNDWILTNFKELSVNYTENPFVYNIELPTDKSYTNTCIVLYATTLNGTVKGVRSVTCLRSCEGAPEVTPTNIKGIFSLAVKNISWSPLPPDVNIWNMADLTAAKYQVDIGYVFGIDKMSNLLINRCQTYDTKNNFIVVNETKQNVLYFLTLAAFSLERGSDSSLYCWINEVTKPSIIPIILNMTNTKFMIVSMTIETVFILDWRGVKFLQLHVKSINLPLPVPFSWNKTLSVSYNNEIESYQNFSRCENSSILAFLSQCSIFNQDFEWYGFFPERIYNLSVAFCNEAGCGNFSSISSIQTGEKPPPCLNISTLHVTSNSWNISIHENWEFCGELGISAYNFSFVDTITLTKTEMVSIKSQLYFDNLLCYRNYCIETDERNVFREILMFCQRTLSSKTYETANIFESNSTKNSFTFTLVMPDAYKICGNLTSLIVLFRQLPIHLDVLKDNYSDFSNFSFRIKHEEFFSSQNKRTFTLTNLSQSTQYEGILLFNTSYGPGQKSEIKFRTLGGPTIKMDFENKSETTDSITLIMKDVYSRYRFGNITFYRICIEQISPYLMNETCKDKSFCLDMTYRLNLSRDGIYIVKVAAATIYGVGVFSDPVELQPMSYGNGSWSEWSPWSQCLNECFGGKTKRKRDCNNPPPYNGGEECSGPSIEENPCNQDGCASESDFRSWASWSVCTATCGISDQIRKRDCLTNNCTGKVIQQNSCFLPPCPVNREWGTWSGYTECNQTCGGGFKMRKRICDNPFSTGDPCYGISEEVIGECNIEACPIHGGESEWSLWSKCDKPCGDNAYKIRNRYCNNPSPKYRGMGCQNNLTETLKCNNLTSCNPMVVIYTIKLINFNWMWQYYNIYAEITRPVVNYATYLITQTLNGYPILNVEVIALKKGSIIVEYKITYAFINSTDIVNFVDSINMHGLLFNESVSILNATSPNIPCQKPCNVSATMINESSVLISWYLPSCSFNTIVNWMYIMYIEHQVVDSLWKYIGVSTNANISTYILSDLKSDTAYRAYLVPTIDAGSGTPSDVFYFRTPVRSPSHVPINVYAVTISPTEIFINWDNIPVKNQNGKLLGYRLRWKKYFNTVFQVKDIPYPVTSSTIKELKPFTLYHIEVNGFNSGGEGPSEYAMVKTIEGVPSAPVPGLIVQDMESIDWWAVGWRPINSEFVNGILLGYRLIYYMSYHGGVEVGGEKQTVVLFFDNVTLYYKAKNMQNYAVYNVSVVGYTAAGYGPGNEYEAKTCKCDKYVFANWYVKKPFVDLKNDKNLTGIFPSLLRDIILQSCGGCKSYSHSSIQFYATRNGVYNDKLSEFALKQSIGSEIDISFPIYGQIGRQVSPKGSFLQLIYSPGMAVIVRNQTNPDELFKKLLMIIYSVLPFFLVSFLIAASLGIVIWFSDQVPIYQQSVSDRSITGMFVGVWFSITTMTTVGYSNFTRSFSARVVVIGLLLISLALNSIIFGSVITKLICLTQVKQIVLYNSKVAALNNSVEYRFAVTKNAQLIGRYDNVESMLKALEVGEVDIVLLEIFAAIPYRAFINNSGLKMASFIKPDTAYGFVLSGLSVALDRDFTSSVKEREPEIAAFVQSLQTNLPILSPVLNEINFQMLFSSSTFFKKFIMYLVWALLAFTCIGLTFDLIRGMKSRCRVRSRETFYEALGRVCDQLRTFKRDFTSKIDELTILHNKERFDLLFMKKTNLKNPESCNNFSFHSINE